MCLMVNGKRRVMAGVPVVEFVLQAGPCVLSAAACCPEPVHSHIGKSSMRAGGFILSCASKLTRQIARMAGYRPLVAANAGNRGSCLAATSATGGRRRRRGGGARGRRSAATARGRDLTRSFRRWPECLRARCARCPTLTVAQQCRVERVFEGTRLHTPPPRKSLASRMELHGTC